MSTSKSGDFPAGPSSFIQIMPEADENCPTIPLISTKVWYHKDYPLIEVGELELNRNPENYFAEVEQAAFNPANVVPASVFRRTRCCSVFFSYGDAATLNSVNITTSSVNKSRCPFHSYRDGQMRVDGNYGSYTNF